MFYFCVESLHHEQQPTGGCVNGREGGGGEGRLLEIFHICVNWALSVWWLCCCALPAACKILLSHNNIIWRMGPDGRYKVRNPLLSNLHLLVWFAVLVADSLLTFNIHFIYFLLIIEPFVFVINKSRVTMLQSIGRMSSAEMKRLSSLGRNRGTFHANKLMVAAREK